MDQYLYKPNNVPVYQKLFQVSVVNLNKWFTGKGNLLLNIAHHSKGSSDVAHVTLKVLSGK